MLAIQPVGAQEAPPSVDNPVTVFNYAEEGTGLVTTYTAKDRDDDTIFWTLGGTDADDFTIVGGVLRFKSSPDYEVPTDRDHDPDGDNIIDDAAGNNVYKLTVRFGGGGQDGMPGLDDYNEDDLGELDLTVNVTNVDEPRQGGASRRYSPRSAPC